MNQPEFICPLCDKPLTLAPGDGRNQTDGFSLFCPNRECPAQEVAGHGSTPENAFKIVQDKYKK